jgi:hypothetical protein
MRLTFEKISMNRQGIKMSDHQYVKKNEIYFFILNECAIFALRKLSRENYLIE